MKTLIIITTAIFALFNADTTIQQSSDMTTLTVEVKGLSSDKGKVYIGLYDKENTWLGKTYKGDVTKISDGKSTVVFTDVPAGTYAISCYHDENDNDKMDTGKFGIPIEDYACSNGAKAWFSAPKWKDAKFELTGGEKSVEIKF